MSRRAPRLRRAARPNPLKDRLYLILTLRAGESHAHRIQTASRLRDARSMAYHAARSLFERRPRWAGASAWHAHDDAPDRTPVGGYDDGSGDGSAVVVFGPVEVSPRGRW